MNENNSKRFIWLFVGLFIILFAFAGFNTISGNVDNKTTVSMDEMIKAIVKAMLSLQIIQLKYLMKVKFH